MTPVKLTMATSLALGTALISGLNTFIGKIGVTAIKDPLIFTTLKNSLVGLLLIGLLVALNKLREINNLSAAQWRKLVTIGLVGGSIPFALFFTGLSQTTALNASLIHKSLFLWVLLLAWPLLKERLNRWQWLGIVTMVAANFLFGGFTGFKFNGGEMMILVATILWAVENIVAKKALSDISPLLLAGARMVFGSVVLIMIAALTDHGASWIPTSGSAWSWTVLSSVLLLGYVLTWYSALKLAPATYIATLLVPATLVTNALTAIFITHNLPLVQITGAILLTTGAALLIKFARQSKGLSEIGLPDQLISR